MYTAWQPDDLMTQIILHSFILRWQLKISREVEPVNLRIFSNKTNPEILRLAINWNYAEHCITKVHQNKWRKPTVFMEYRTQIAETPSMTGSSQ
jgi:hypothetical protein